MNIARQIEYPNARSYFREAELRGKKLIMGNMNTNFWLHREKINLDFVLETAKRFSDARVFIISDGMNKGFYLYSDTRQMCLQLMDINTKYAHAEFA
jgi:hypothetical protein